MCTYKNGTYFSPIVEKIKPGDMSLFLKIKLDKETHIEVQYHLIDNYENKQAEFIEPSDLTQIQELSF